MESSLECGICFSEYNTDEQLPKSLPCGHSVCSSCIQDNLKAKDGKMSCPFCRTPCGTGVKTLNDFPTTFALLSLIGTDFQKGPSKALSPKEKENKVLLKKKQTVFDNTKAHISNCNENLQGLLHAIDTQESAIKSIRIGKKKLLEDYQQEQNKLDDAEEKATSMKDKLDNIVAEGNDIVKGFEALQDRVHSASSIFGLNMVSQDVQRYNEASKEWVTTRVNTIVKDKHLLNQNQISTDEADNDLTQDVKCRRRFAVGEFFYSCLQCRTAFGCALCGSCFVNSAHLTHRYEIRQSGGTGGYCDCGVSDLWMRNPTCSKHIRINQSEPEPCSASMYALSKCKQLFYEGEKCYTCIDCRTGGGFVLCGTCFINSSHRQHKFEIHTATTDGAFCDCGLKNVWKRGDTCNIHA